jgi:aspartyl protease family protein
MSVYAKRHLDAARSSKRGESMSASGIRVIVIFLLICSGLAFVFRDEIKQLASAPAKVPAKQQPALDTEALRSVYAKLKIEPLSPDATASPPIAGALKDLINSACDKTAIFRLSNELAKLGERRTAANALLGFANTCPNSEGELNGAANVLFGMGDYAGVIPVADKLIAKRSNVGQYYYVRGQALNYLGRSGEAVEDISSAIALFDNIKLVSSQAFQMLASAYAADGKFCQAMTAIQTYVYADSQARDTAATRKLVADYAARGNCDVGYAEGMEIVPRTRQDVTLAKVTINGVKGTFVIDTGASVVTVDAAFAEKAKVASQNSRKVITHTANGVAEATLTTAASVQLGRVRAENVSLAIISKPIGNGIDGLLGMSFLARFDVTMGERELRIQARKTATSDSSGAN